MQTEFIWLIQHPVAIGLLWQWQRTFELHKVNDYRPFMKQSALCSKFVEFLFRWWISWSIRQLTFFKFDIECQPIRKSRVVHCVPIRVSSSAFDTFVCWITWFKGICGAWLIYGEIKRTDLQLLVDKFALYFVLHPLNLINTTSAHTHSGWFTHGDTRKVTCWWEAG